jgi:transcriptional regulator with XRE-family HTH domain
MAEPDPFAGLGEALTRLRERAGFSTQTQASKALKIDKGQLSRWENESLVPRSKTSAGCSPAMKPRLYIAAC